ncbi:MAG: sugar ABC transporter permease [Candidatus Wallbacteria bacterium]|nr:sugar ABC transporter permease [Candidatus Wallbacteria bacterium]
MNTAFARKLKENSTAFSFLFPFLAVFSLFLIFPIVYSLYLSLCEKSGYSIAGLKFVGLKNYQALFKDAEFWWSLLMTFYYALLTIPAGIFLSLMLALLLNNRLPGKLFFRSVFFLPNVLDLLVVGIIWKLLYTSGGLVVTAMQYLGFGMEGGILGNPWTALPGIALAMVLKGSGFGMILFLAALQNIPESVFEAAEIDGATGFECFRHITLPLLRPIMLFMIITGTMAALNTFTEIYAMTDNGGPVVLFGKHTLGATKLTGYYLFSKWENHQYGYAAAMSYVLLVVTVAISLFNSWLLRRKD